MKNNIFTLKEFREVMNEWKQIHELRTEFTNLSLQHTDLSMSFPTLEWTLHKTLCKMFNDNDDLTWIEYFVYDLDWGKMYCDGMVKDANGNIIKLATIEDLYNVLIKEMEENGKL